MEIYQSHYLSINLVNPTHTDTQTLRPETNALWDEFDIYKLQNFDTIDGRLHN